MPAVGVSGPATAPTRSTTRRRALLDSSGNVTMLFAAAIVPIALLSVAAFDLTQLQGDRAKAQQAADAAVLAVARRHLELGGLPEGERQLQAEAVGQAIFQSLTQDIQEPPTIDFDFRDGIEVVGNVTIERSMMFGEITGKHSQTVELETASQVGDPRPVEVVLVLDNTASMFTNDRFTMMRQAAKGFVDTMFDQSPNPALTRIGVVPWSTTVNINAEAPMAPSAARGAASNPAAAGTRLSPNTPAQNRLGYLSHPDTGATVNQNDLNTMFAPVGWRGCIRAAPGEVTVNSSGRPTGATTDAPPAGMRWPVNWIEPELRDKDGKQRNCTSCPPPPRTSPPPPRNPPPSSPPPPRNPPPPPRGPQGFNDWPGADYPSYASADSLWSIIAGPAEPSARLVCTPEQPKNTGQTTPGGKPIKTCGNYPTGVKDCNQSDNNGLRNAYVPRTEVCTQNGTDFSRQILACVSDPNEFDWIGSGGRICSWRTNNQPWTSNQPVLGPNLNCPTAMLPLSANRAQVIAKLDHMYPVPGGTQADVGLRWAMRVLSPRSEWRSFFSMPAENPPGPWEPEDTRKVAILLTDGENIAPIDFEGYYGCTETNRGSAGACWRAPGLPTLTDSMMDNLTLNVCEALRDTYEVELYTIAVDVPPGRGTQLLEDCAGEDGRFFNISSAELGVTFDAIAQRELRLVR